MPTTMLLKMENNMARSCCRFKALPRERHSASVLKILEEAEDMGACRFCLDYGCSGACVVLRAQRAKRSIYTRFPGNRAIWKRGMFLCTQNVMDESTQCFEISDDLDTPPWMSSVLFSPAHLA